MTLQYVYVKVCMGVRGGSLKADQVNSGCFKARHVLWINVNDRKDIF